MELEKHMTCGQTPEETITNLKEALRAYVETSITNGMKIPEPAKLADYKGNITYRTSSETHYKLVVTTKILGISVNTLIDEAVKYRLETA